MKKLLLVALSTFAISAHAWEPKLYAGASFSSWDFKAHTIVKNFRVPSLEVTGGAVVCPYISFEGRVGTGISSDRANVRELALDPQGDPIINDDGEPLTVVNKYSVTMDYYASAYFRPFLANETASLYGLLGVTTMQVRRAPDREMDASYGFGVSFVTSEHTKFIAEWKKLINAEEFDMSGGTVGFTYQF